MKTQTILLILLAHFICDFVFQTDWQAQNKSKNNKALLSHVTTYSLIMFFILIIYTLFGWIPFNPFAVCSFITITFVCHFITDYFTSRINTRLREQKKVHYFFVSIGADQMYHYIQLFITFQFLFL